LSSEPFDTDDRRELLNWYHSHGRDLPWRRTSDPYRIWISEIMLQQTQVKTVLPRYAAWFESFPDIASLARSSLDAVLKTWEGLGYYRRARLLHAAARQIEERHDGLFPENFADITALSGIGRSTAGAIASICFGQPTPVLDGNVKRVLQRWKGDQTLGEKRMWELAQELIDTAPDPAEWNQLMMELGATLCSPRSPGCSHCPVHKHCRSAFSVSEPGPGKTVRVKDLYWQVELHTSEKGIWLMQRPATGIWAGLWTPPITELEEAPDSEPDHIHLLTHRRLHLYAETSDNTPEGDGLWVGDLSLHALPTGIHRLLAKIMS